MVHIGPVIDPSKLRGNPSGRGLAARTIPITSVLNIARRAQSVNGGQSIAGTGLPDPGANTRPAAVFRRRLAQSTGSSGLIEQALALREAGGGALSRRGNVSPSQAVDNAVAGIRPSFGLTPTDRVASFAIPGITGVASSIFGGINRFLGSPTGVLGAGAIAPRPGTQAFGQTVAAGRTSRALSRRSNVGNRSGGRLGGPF